MTRITKALSVGPFAIPERAKDLLAAGVTHVLNVSDGPSAVGAGAGSFVGVNGVSMPDSRRLPRATVVQALDALHGLMHFFPRPRPEVVGPFEAGEQTEE